MKKTFWGSLLVGVLILWTGLFVFIRNPTFRGEVLPYPVAVNIDNLKKDTYFLADLTPNRSTEHPASLHAAEMYIMTRLKEMGYTWTLQDLYGEDGEVYHNIIVRYGEAKAKAEAKELVVVGAHFDACDEKNPGADDNASGVAGLLELLRLFKEHQPKSKTPIEFVFYNLEEPPYFGTEGMGSAYHADALHTEKTNVKYALSIEMIGYFSDDSFSQEFPFGLLYFFYPHQGNFIALIGSLQERDLVKDIKKAMNANSQVPAYSLNAPSFVEGVDYSDHRNYWKHDWPAVMITNTSFYRNKAYHTPQDTADRLNYVKMGEVVKGIYAFLVLN